MTGQTIAFVGLGTMGLPMAQALVNRQMRVTGYDVRPAAVEKLVTMGGSGATTAAAAAKGAGVLVLMVVHAEQAEAVLFEGGALAALAPGATVILTGSRSRARRRSLHENGLAVGGLRASAVPRHVWDGARQPR